MPDPEEIARKYISPRSAKLDQLESYVNCTQYRGKVAWFDTSSHAPLFDRAPCINYPIARTAISSHVAFVLGENHWPTFTSAPSENDETLGDEWGLSKEDSEQLDAWTNLVLVKFARLKKLARETLGDAMASRSVAIVTCVRAGRLIAETIKASWCTPTLDDNDEVERLEIRYPFIEEFYDDSRRQWDTRCLLYRRVIDDVNDTVYLPAKASTDGREPEWAINPAKTTTHGLGFCPVIWYPFMKPCSTAGNIDGVALHEHQLGEIDCLNIALSQKQRAATTAGDPQMVEVGVEDDVNPAPMGVTSRGGIKSLPGSPGAKSAASVAVFGEVGGGGRSRARKRGAGVVWRYPNEKTRVEYLHLPGDALKAIDDHAKDLRDKIAEALFAVLVDPSSLKMHAAMSGKALAFLFSRQVGFCDQIRQDFADRCLLPLISMLLRMVSVVGRKNARALRLPGVAKILPLLARFEQQASNDNGEPAGRTVWMSPRLEPVWGPYFPPNEQDQLSVVQVATQAKDGGLITTQQGVEKLSKEGVFNVGSAAEVVEAIEEERKAKQDEAMSTMHALGGQIDGPPVTGTPKPDAAPGQAAA